jgi:hypothetical protein
MTRHHDLTSWFCIIHVSYTRNGLERHYHDAIKNIEQSIDLDDLRLSSLKMPWNDRNFLRGPMILVMDL